MDDFLEERNDVSDYMDDALMDTTDILNISGTMDIMDDADGMGDMEDDAGSEGEIVDNDNDNDNHDEGQGDDNDVASSETVSASGPVLTIDSAIIKNSTRQAELKSKPIEPGTSGTYRVPTAFERKLREGLVGSRIRIYWDGDDVFYPCTVVRYNPGPNSFQVLYENDTSGQEYEEFLSQSVWHIFAWKSKPPKSAVSSSASSNKLSYVAMAVEAVFQLDDRNGSSLQSIRKYMLANFEIKKQHVASYNSLTLKAVNKAVASGELERLTGTHSFRVSAAYKQRRREKELRALGLGPDGRPIGGSSSSSSSSSSSKGEILPKREYGADNHLESAVDSLLQGTVGENNRYLRRQILDARQKRDIYMQSHFNVLAPFLPLNNYFQRKEKKESELAAVAGDVASSSSTIESALAMVGDNAVQGVEVTATNSESSTIESGVATVGDNVVQGVEVTATNGGESADTIKVDEMPTVNAAVLESQPIITEIADVAVPAPGIESAGVPVIVAAADPVAEGTVADAEDEVEGQGKDIANAANDAFVLRGIEIVPQASTLVAELHQHQVQGISWMVHMFRNGMPMILGDQMGLGKTIQSIGFLAYIKEFLGQSGPHLVVVPLSVMSNWLAEIERFCPSFRAIRFHGPKEERNRIKNEEMASLAEFDIVVTTFEMLVSESNFFRRRFLWTCLIVDEGHRLKNSNSQLSDKLRNVPCLSKIILTGTPLQNNLKELWSLFHFLCPEIFSSATSAYFDEGFDLLKGVIDTQVLRRARKLLSLFMLRRVKDEVAIKLPSRREVTVLVPLTDDQVAWYKQLLCGLDADTIEAVMKESTPAPTIDAGPSENSSATSTEVVASTTGRPSASGSNAVNSGDSDWRKLMNLLLQLRKVCNHTYLMPGGAPEPYFISQHIVGGSGKLMMLDRMLPLLKQNGHRVLLFSQFTSMLDILEDYCELRDYCYVRLDGETNRVKRRLDVRRFNSPNSKIFIFLISTRAGGLGLNLASADTVILYDSDWNPQVDLQAMERAHRIGQTKPVRVYRLICRGSVEERMVMRAEKKLFLNAMVAEADPDEIVNEHAGADGSGTGAVGDSIAEALGISGGTAMSKAELASLIRFGANAIFESARTGLHLSDQDLHILLELSGRDLSQTPPANNCAAVNQIENDQIVSEEQSVVPAGDGSTLVETAFWDRVEKLQEVDLRQLGDTVFVKKAKKLTATTIDNSNIIVSTDESGLVKRARKERIVMIDGRGSGYGGRVPMLAKYMEDTITGADSSTTPAKDTGARSRQWNHFAFCGLCGKTKSPETFALCAHCPRSFHGACMEAHFLPRPNAGMFICPHHKCAYCFRNTASAGGMLFRCTGCLTAYCEDCLPQDEIESLGRCRDLETLGYDSKQSYYIKCPACCVTENVHASGIEGAETNKLGDDVVAPDNTAGAEAGDPGVPAIANTTEEASLLLSQTLRMHWEALPDSEDERREKARLKKAQRELAKKAKAELLAKRKAERENQHRASRTPDDLNSRRSGRFSRGQGESSPATDTRDGKKLVLSIPNSSQKRLHAESENDSVSDAAPKRRQRRGQEADTDENHAEVVDSDRRSSRRLSGTKEPAKLETPSKVPNDRSKQLSAVKDTPKRRAVENSSEIDGSSSRRSSTRLRSSGANGENSKADDDSSQSDSNDETEGAISLVKVGEGMIPDPCTISSAGWVLLTHPITVEDSHVANALLGIQTKLDMGRYRSVTAFVGDVRAALTQLVTRFKSPSSSPVKAKAGKERLSSTPDGAQELLAFFDSKLVPKLEN